MTTTSSTYGGDYGVYRGSTGRFYANTRTEAKSFKTLAGATRWLAARGYQPDGTMPGSQP